jgi:hypothetical protein
MGVESAKVEAHTIGRGTPGCARVPSDHTECGLWVHIERGELALECRSERCKDRTR